MELIASGLTPIDQAAQEIAALVPKKVAAKKPSLPIRKDVYVYNEATGMMLTSMRTAGKTLEDGSAAWMKAARKGEFLPLSLLQDDPFTVRVVVGGDLEAAEQEEWVARVDWHLNLKDGKLCVTGGAPLVQEDYEEDDSYTEQYVRRIDVPKGHYRVSLYSYVPGVNGSAALDELAGGYGKAEPVGQWFRRTRRDEQFPLWLREWCIGDRSNDPGHEGEWAGKPILGDQAWPDYVHFLIHLIAVNEVPKSGLTELPESGWFDMGHNARKPDRCPLGIEGREVSGHVSEGGSTWIFGQDAFRLCEEYTPQVVSGGPLALPLKDVALCIRLGWFRARMSHPGIRIKLPSGRGLNVSAGNPQGIILVSDRDLINVVFSNDLQPREYLVKARELSGLFETLPDGAVLEVCSSLPPEAPGSRPETGTSRLEGEVRSGMWDISSVYPAVSAADLHDAFELARQTVDGDEIMVANQDEGERILAKGNSAYDLILEDNPGRIEGGALRLRTKDPVNLSYYGAAAFTVRFGKSWSAEGPDDEESDG